MNTAALPFAPRLGALLLALLAGPALAELGPARPLPEPLQREARAWMETLAAELGRAPDFRAGERYVLEQAPGASTYLGVVLRWDHEASMDRQGVPVLAVTAGSPAEAMGIAPGDRVQSINGASLLDAGADGRGRALGAGRFNEQLQALPAGAALRLGVLRDGRARELNGRLGQRLSPGFRLELAPAAGKPAASGACGTVSTFFRPPETRYLYPAAVARIDERNVFEEQKEYRLAPGTYTLKVYEEIVARELRVHPRNRGYSKPLSVTVEAGKVYRIGAKFNHRQPFDRDEYWEPVVWEVKDRPCQW